MKTGKSFSVFAIILMSAIVAAGFIMSSASLDDVLSGYFSASGTYLITDWSSVSGEAGAAGAAEPGRRFADRLFVAGRALTDARISLSAVIPPQSADRQLILMLNGDDIRITLDGVLQDPEIQTGPLTLRHTLILPLPASAAARELNLQAGTGLLFDIRAAVADRADVESMAQAGRDIAISLIISIAMAGILMFLLSLILAIRLRKTARMAWTGLLLLGTAAGILLCERYDLFDIKARYLPAFFLNGGYPKEIVALLSVLLFAVFLIFSRSIEKKSVLLRILPFLLLLTGVLQSMPDISAYYAYIMYGYAAFTVLSGIIYLIAYRASLSSRYFSDRFHAFSFFLVTLCMAYDFLNPVLRLYSGNGGIFHMAVLVFAASDIYRSVTLAIHINVRITERAMQRERSRRHIERIFEESARIFAAHEFEGFCIQTAQSVRNLISDDLDENRYKSTKVGPTPERELGISVAVRDPGTGAYREIYNAGGVEGCDYPGIERSYRRKKKGGVLFGGNYVAMLLLVSGEPAAIIYIEGIPEGISDSLRNILDIAYSNIAMAPDNLKLREDILQTRESVFTYLAEMTEAKSEETGMHLKRVSEYVRAMCYEMGMSPEESRVVAIGSMMHDVGKLAIPEELINKKGKLTEEEYETVKQHVRYGNNMLSKSEGEYMAAGAVIAQQHHERWDGEGYLGLKGENIHKYARITALADVFDALTSSRSYKTAWSVEEASGYMIEKSGTQFDPEVVNVFLRCVDRIREIRNQYPD